MDFPPMILNHENGVGCFSTPEEGVEYLINFNEIISGLRKQGVDLTVDEMESIRGAMMNDVTGPAFIRRLVTEHGAESIPQCFLIRDQLADLVLEFLLRRYKGDHFRRRYPAISLVGGGARAWHPQTHK